MRSEFLRNFRTLFTGTVIAQTIPLLAAPLLSRIYTPDDFSLNEVFMRVYSIFLILSSLRYEQAIILAKSITSANALLKLILKISSVVSVALLLIVLFFGKEVSLLLESPQLENYLILCPIAIIIAANYQSLSNYCVRLKEFKRLSSTRATVSVANTGYRVLFGLFTGGHPFGLISSLVFSQGLGFVMLKWKKAKGLFTSSSSEEVSEVAKTYSDFPKINTFHALLDSFRDALIIYLIIAFLGNTTLGLYAFTIRLMKLPLGMVGSALGQVFYQKAAETHNAGGDTYSILKKAMVKMAMLSLPVFALIALLSPLVFSWVFGEEWQQAGKMAQIFSVWMYFVFLNSPFSQIPLIFDKQKQIFVMSLFGTAISVLSLYLGSLWYSDAMDSFLLFSLAQSAYLAFVLIWTLRISKKKA